MTLAPPPPPHVSLRPAGTRLIAGLRHAEVVADFDLETYSEAGFLYDEVARKWIKTATDSKGRGGLPAVGSAVYAQHPSTEILSLSYNLKDGKGVRRWRPGMPLPFDLYDHIVSGKLLEAFNSGFEWWVWNHVGVRYGWPPVKLEQLRCAQAKGRAWSLPPSLGEVGRVLRIEAEKDADGQRLLKLFSVPRNPTKKDPRCRIRPDEEPIDGPKLYAYNDRDIEAEAEVSASVPDMTPQELEYWLLDREINTRGVHIDRAGVENCIALIEQCHERYNTELAVLTGGVVQRGSEVQKLLGWLGGHKFYMASLDSEAVDAALDRIKAFEEVERNDGFSADGIDVALQFEDMYAVVDLPAVKRALQIRQAVGSASVKKVFAMRSQVSSLDRLHELFTFHGARTGRPTGSGSQPTNLPNSGPEVRRCWKCQRWYPADEKCCTACFAPRWPGPASEWCVEAAEDALHDIATRSLDLVEMRWGDAMGVLGGCLRPLFNAADGHDLICSDYSAIEAVVNAELSGEKWRVEVFHTHGKIYEASAAQMFNLPVETLLDYKKQTGNHHPLRKKGKVAELALGYLGWIGALRDMGGYDGSDDEAKQLCLDWRWASPNIVFMGGGQKAHPALVAWHRAAILAGGVENEGPAWEALRQAMKGSKPWDNEPYLHGIEGMTVLAIQNPGQKFPVYRLDGTPSGLTMQRHGDALYMHLPDGTAITYHKPRLGEPTADWRGLSISYEGWNTNPKSGPYGWIRMSTYAGKLLENACQAVANRILRHGQLRLRAAGYPIVLHVYDENVAEVPEGFGSVEEFEREMSAMPAWAVDKYGRPWPIFARGGWRGKRYRK